MSKKYCRDFINVTEIFSRFALGMIVSKRATVRDLASLLDDIRHYLLFIM